MHDHHHHDHGGGPTQARAKGIPVIGVGGPVGSGKTALVEALCRRLRDRWSLAVVTNDIFTKEDAEFLTRRGVLPPERIVGVETGGCPHTAIREDASHNQGAIDDLVARFPDVALLFVESGGDNLAATFSPELADRVIYVIDVAAGDKIPRKGGPGITRSDLLVINKIDLAPHVGADLAVMERDSRALRGDRPFVFTNLLTGEGVPLVQAWVERLLSPLKTGFAALAAVWTLLLAGCGGTVGPSHCDPARVAHETEADRALESRKEIEEPEAGKGPSPEDLAAVALMEKKMLDARACRQAGAEPSPAPGR